MGFRPEPRLGQQGSGTVDVLRRDDQIDVARDQGFLGPMVDRHAANGASGHFGLLQGRNQAQHVVRAARRLPIIELPSSHIGTISNAFRPANTF